mmetsp:Transcript_38883/g.82741  ORF Transcript_38883/g.82741 Transcript_38883/m.82741 type:complete len:265 (-) Transcript_38883:748-1542(-)
MGFAGSSTAATRLVAGTTHRHRWRPCQGLQPRQLLALLFLGVEKPIGQGVQPPRVAHPGVGLPALFDGEAGARVVVLRQGGGSRTAPSEDARAQVRLSPESGGLALLGGGVASSYKPAPPEGEPAIEPAIVGHGCSDGRPAGAAPAAVADITSGGAAAASIAVADITTGGAAAASVAGADITAGGAAAATVSVADIAAGSTTGGVTAIAFHSSAIALADTMASAAGTGGVAAAGDAGKDAHAGQPARLGRGCHRRHGRGRGRSR